jgi:ubiquinone/menaquinone biosynthesis C-methylase UbiE
MRLIATCALALTMTATATSASAQLAARSAEEWLATLESPARLQGLKIPETVQALKLKPGDVVADIGAGSGAFEQALSAAVGPAGKVYAEEVDKGLVKSIAKRAAGAGLGNVTPVLGTFSDPALPARDVDLAFINDVLHHIQDRPGYLLALSKYIKPDGRIALIDFRPQMGGHRDQPDLQIPKAQADAWLAAAGFRPAEEIELFTDKYFVIYARRGS